MNKKDFEEMALLYRDQISVLRESILSLKEENQRLADQNLKLQDGLLAIRAPEVYRDYRNDMSPVPEVPQEKRDRDKKMLDIASKYVNSLEEPLFTDAQDMEDLLGPTLYGKVIETESTHGNTES